ncbi:hypothetical protein [Deinococcus sp. Marseille-Q6407]|uniref:hypothetical protein n=1 Tax=Deinococcus sp. Marseille-Q6407 TaxID=2969223 RepID=UPI0021C10900|nr:hypothetical protein [Deinococcus sp. Marseille-Q6407]
MGLNIEEKTVQVKRRWTRLNVDKRGGPGEAVLTEETGTWTGQDAWVTMSSRQHRIGRTALAQLMTLPLSKLGLSAKSTLGDVMDAMTYGVLTGQLPYQVTLRPVVTDADGQPVEGAVVHVENRYIFGEYPADAVPVLDPDESYTLTVRAPGYQEQHLAWQPTLGEWKPEVQLQRFEPVPPPEPPAAEVAPAAED